MIEREQATGMIRLRAVAGVKDWMEKVTVSEDEVKKVMKRMKNGKQGGLDGIKGEMYKALGGSERCMERLVGGFNEMLETGEVSGEWKKSKTRMIAKVKKPRVREHRPIALTSVGYKLFMGEWWSTK